MPRRTTTPRTENDVAPETHVTPSDDGAPLSRRGADRATSALSRDGDDTGQMSRPGIDSWSPPEQIRTPPPKDGYVYRWVREFVNGYEDRSNVEKRMTEGWVRVNVEEVQDFFFTLDAAPDNFVRRQGLILMKTPAKFVEQRNSYYGNRRRMRSYAADHMQGIQTPHQVVEDRGSGTYQGERAGRLLRDF